MMIMYIKIIAVGQKMEKWVNDACAQYQKHLQSFARISVVELPFAPRPKNPSSAQIAHAKLQEAKLILANLDKQAQIWLLDVEGREFCTPSLAQKLANAPMQVNFIIGGADGVDGSVRASADIVWSLSKLTLPHPLARVVAIEQIYRALSIKHGHPYHRA